MIVKNKTPTNTNSVKQKAGDQQEFDVAFFLRRSFKDNKFIHVINDLKFTFNEETAQIDHLIIYPYGFILVESKSITGEVKVNEHGEWSRSWNNKWSGMASPIKQLELQQRLLREFLYEHRSKILTKKFMGVQMAFGGLCWSNLCAVSSKSILNRESIPEKVSQKIVKSEFLVDTLNGIMKLKYYPFIRLNFFDSRLHLNSKELASVTRFLLQNANLSKTPIKDKQVMSDTSLQIAVLKCKHCGELLDYSARSGRYGYFIYCNICAKNTAMKRNCLNCNCVETRVKKKKDTYTLHCESCKVSFKFVKQRVLENNS